MRLFDDPIPPTLSGIDLQHGSADDFAESGDLAVADPPWLYERQVGATSPEDHYSGLTIPEIVAHLEALDAPRLALWITWPVLASDWPESLPKWGRPVTGGAWFKSDQGDSGHYGQGYHWAGCSEPVLIYTRKVKGRNLYTNRAEPLRNAWHSPPEQHSRKPPHWMAQWVRRWVPPGGHVIEPYAGLAATAEAVIRAGGSRTYAGRELDEERHRHGLALLAKARWGLA